MMNNRARGVYDNQAVEAWLRRLSKLEEIIYQQINFGLAEGKSRLKSKEIHKQAYFKLHWERMKLSQARVTDAQSITNVFTQVASDFDQSLKEYCENNKINQTKMFTEQKIALFKALIPFRQLIELQRYWLSTFTPSDALSSIETYTVNLSSRSSFVQQRMESLNEKLEGLIQENKECQAFIQVIVGTIQGHELGFKERAQEEFKGVQYPVNLLLVSTVLNGLPHEGVLKAAMQRIDGRLASYPEDLEVAQQTIERGVDNFELLIGLFEEDDKVINTVCHRFDESLSDWLRRQEELARLIPNLNIQLGKDLSGKLAHLASCDLEGALEAVINGCRAMSNKRVWPDVAKIIQKEYAKSQNDFDEFTQRYGVYMNIFNASRLRVEAFLAWHTNVFLPAVTTYREQVQTMHAISNESLMIFHQYHALLKQYQMTHAEGCRFFLKHHAGKISLGGVLGAGIALPMCIYLFALDIPHSLAYAGVSLLTGAAGGFVVGGVKERCRPSLDEAEARLIEPVPEGPSETDPIIPSHRAPSYALKLFPSIQYQKNRDLESGEGMPRKMPSYGSMT